MSTDGTAVARKRDQNRKGRHVSAMQMASTLSHCNTIWAAKESIVDERGQDRCTDSGRKGTSSGSRLGQAAAKKNVCSSAQRHRAFVISEDAHTTHGHVHLGRNVSRDSGSAGDLQPVYILR